MAAIKNCVVFAALFFLLFGCSTTTSLPEKKRPQQRYADKIAALGLKQTALGEKWFAAARRALQMPVGVSLPYKEVGYFAAADPRGVGLKILPRRGQTIFLSLEKNAEHSFTLFLELWRIDVGGVPKLLLAVDTAQTHTSFEIKTSDTLVLRLQPELLASGAYTLSIATGPSLSFPVAGRPGNIGSFWGDARDAGKRRHEGIDIFAPKGTPALAAAAGTISRVTENKLGGKVVLLQPTGKNIFLYYAHLGRQLVAPGLHVHTGDTVGTIDNTGNAKHTPSHLHFGIYTVGGAIDPLPFVDPQIDSAGAVRFSGKALQQPFRLAAPVQLHGQQFATNTYIDALAATSDGFMVAFVNNVHTWLPRQKVVATGKPLLSVTLSADVDGYLLEQPVATAARLQQLPAGARAAVFGYWKDFAFVMLQERAFEWVCKGAFH